MSHIAQERFHKGESSLISIDFLDGLHVAKLQQRLPASFDGREAGPKVVRRLHRDVFFEFGSQELLVPRGRRPRDQPPEEPPQCLSFQVLSFRGKESFDDRRRLFPAPRFRL